MRAVVTGAAGFVGANLVSHLLEEGHEVHATYHPESDCTRLHEIGAVAAPVLHGVDLAGVDGAETLIGELLPQWVFHLAAHGAYSWQTDARRICEVNLAATIALADAAERCGVQAFINAGSSSEYGFKDHAAVETERLDPNSTYAVTKAAATTYCRHRAHAGRLPAVTLRLYSVYGALEDSRRLVCRLLTEGLRERLPPLVSPDTGRDFVYVGDVCEAFSLAAARAGEKAGEIYNVGSGRQTSLRELVRCVSALLGISAEPSWGTHPQRQWDAEVWCANVERIARDLDWQAHTDLERGLRLTLAAMDERPELLGAI